jgi:hypothetical protein
MGGENGIVVQPVHEILPRGRVRGGSRSLTRAVPLSVLLYLLAHFLTACQLSKDLMRL